MNRFIGLIVLCCAVAVGFGSIAGCPKKTTKDTSPPTPGKFTLSIPETAEIDIAKEKGSFEVKITRDSKGGEAKEAKVKVTGEPKGVTLKVDPIAKDKDSTTVDVSVDKAKAESGTTDLTVEVTHGDMKQEAKVKLKLKKGGEEQSKLTITVPPEVTVEIAKEKGSFDVTIKRENVTGQVDVKVEGAPKGVTFKADPIAKDSDKTTVNVTIDKAEAKAGDTDITVWATHAELKADAKTKLKLK